MAKERTTLSYLLDPEFEFWISGRWSKGGLVEIFYDDHSVGFLRLPRVRWAVFTTLAQQAMQAQSPIHAFMTADEILAVLRRGKVLLTSDPDRVVRLIYELRNDLDEAKARKFQKVWDGEQGKWGKRVIETHQLGYRLSIPPENIHVEILGTGPDAGLPLGSSAVGTVDQSCTSFPTIAAASEQTPFEGGARR